MSLFLTHLALFSVALIYAVTYNIIKFVTPEHIDPLGLTTLRITGAALLFVLFHQTFVRERIRERKDFLRLALCALFGVVLNQVCFVKGVSITTPINASVIMILTPLMVLLASAVLLKERLTRNKILGIVLGAVGVFWMIGGADFRLEAETAMGDLLILTNAACYGLYLVLVKPLLVRYQAVTVIHWVFLFGSIGILPFGWPYVESVSWASVPLPVYGYATFIIVATTFLAYLLNGWALGKVHPSVVGFYVYLQPILATLIAIWIGTDVLTLQKITAAALIFAGVYAVSIPEKSQKEHHAS